jgi:hypothetical protein
MNPNLPKQQVRFLKHMPRRAIKKHAASDQAIGPAKIGYEITNHGVTLVSGIKVL